MSLGRFILGQFVPISVTTKSGETPFAPTFAPVFRVYDAEGVFVAAGKMPPSDRGVTGEFAFNLRLNDDFDLGNHSVCITYMADGSARIAVQHFEVVAGGDPAGAVVSQYFYDRPHASFIVTRLDSNARQLLKNPRL